jgi:pyruvate formate lyase activating enzyme
MVLGGIQKISLIDYPGKISCVLFTVGCNFRCPYCHNPSLVLADPWCREPIMEEEAVFRFLESRRAFLEGVVVSGGEPTLHPDILSFCERVKEMGYSLKLDTNGSRPQVIEHLIENGLVDYIAMDIKTLPDLYEAFLGTQCRPQAILSSIRLILERGKEHEFRTTCVKPFINDQVMEDIARLIEGARGYALQKFIPTCVLRPEFFQGAGSACTVEELGRLKSIAEKWVQPCIVRC